MISIEAWQPVKFYVVDVPGPAVVGLPTREQLNLVTINVDSLGSQATQKGACPGKIKDVNDLAQAYPEQVDKIDKFQSKAKLLLKDG